MKSLTLYIFSVLIFLVACRKQSNILESYGQVSVEKEIENIFIKQVDYDRIQIGSDGIIYLYEKSINQVVLGHKEDGIFFGEDTLIPTYEQKGDGYYFSYQFDKSIDRRIIEFDFTLQFIFYDSNKVEVDSTAPMYKYPYQSTEIFITADEVFSEYGAGLNFQDIDLNDTHLFSHPNDSMGIYRYNFNMGISELLFETEESYFIAQDSNFIFYDKGSKILRYNLDTGLVDLEINIASSSSVTIIGIEAYNNILYLLVLYLDQLIHLRKFDYDGNALGFIKYRRPTSYMTIANNILYSIDVFEECLSRYDLNAGRFLENRSLPTKNWRGIRIHNNKLYYTDNEKRIICYIPISELED